MDFKDNSLLLLSGLMDFKDNSVLLLSGAAFSVAVLCTTWALSRRRDDYLKDIQGPPSKSWIFGAFDCHCNAQSLISHCNFRSHERVTPSHRLRQPRV